MVYAQVSHFSKALPKSRITSRETEALIRAHSPGLALADGTIESLTKIASRAIADVEIQASDLAIAAGAEALASAKLEKSDVGALIFASASQDILEPATATIIQQKLGLSCPAFDIKNACNSFMNGLEVAMALVTAGTYPTVLVTTGEVPTRLIDYHCADKKAFKAAFPSFTLGDAGGAALVTANTQQSNVQYHHFYTEGAHWRSAAVLGGGSLFPRSLEHMRFSTQPERLHQSFFKLGVEPLNQALLKAGLERSDLKKIFVHQVASHLTDATIELLKLPSNKVYRTVERYGNLASASLPVAIHEALEKGEIVAGDTILIIGLASGISATVWLMHV